MLTIASAGYRDSSRLHINSSYKSGILVHKFIDNKWQLIGDNFFLENNSNNNNNLSNIDLSKDGKILVIARKSSIDIHRLENNIWTKLVIQYL